MKRDSPRWDLHLPVGLLVCLSACSVSVQDQTPSPPNYSYSPPLGFPIAAKAHKEGLVTDPTVSTWVVNLGVHTTGVVNFPVAMVRTAPGAETFAGRFPPPYNQKRLFTGCGFKVQHQAKGYFLAFIPVLASVVADVPGNPWAQYVEANTTASNVDISFPLTGGGVVTSGTTITTVPLAVLETGGLTFLSGYDQALTVNSATFTCKKGCGNPPGISGTSVTTPYVMNCGELLGVAISCEAGTDLTQYGAQVIFDTSLGTITVPLSYCQPDFGA